MLPNSQIIQTILWCLEEPFLKRDVVRKVFLLIWRLSLTMGRKRKKNEDLLFWYACLCRLDCRAAIHVHMCAFVQDAKNNVCQSEYCPWNMEPYRLDGCPAVKPTHKIAPNFEFSELTFSIHKEFKCTVISLDGQKQSQVCCLLVHSWFPKLLVVFFFFRLCVSKFIAECSVGGRRRQAVVQDAH